MPPSTPPVKLNPLMECLGEYQKKGVGVDMILKSALGIFRLMMLYSHDQADKKKYAQVADVIIECRMLCNFGRPTLTAHQAYQNYWKKDRFEFFYWLFTTLSYAFRVPEQISGDLNYLQKVVFHSWNREKFSFYYRFFKSINLTCAFIAEALRRRALMRDCTRAKTVEVLRRIRDEIRVADVVLLRTLCDMYVYYKWVPFYNPPKTIEYICGSVSGLLGVWLVWKDIWYVTEGPPACAPTTKKKEVCALKRMNSTTVTEDCDE